MDPRLLEAVHRGDTNELKKLCNENGDVLETNLNESSETVLHIAVLAGHVGFVKELLKMKADLAKRANIDRYLPLHFASANGSVEMVREMLMVDPELARVRSNVNGWTCLHYAAVNGRVAVLNELLRLCPDQCKNDVTFRGETALHLAVKNNQFETLKAMIQVLAKEHSINEIVNAKDQQGNTILHLAAANMHMSIAKLLVGGQVLNQGLMDVNAINKSGLTAMDVLEISEQMIFYKTDWKLRTLFQSIGAKRSKDFATNNDGATSTVQRQNREQAAYQRSIQHSLLNEVKAFNPITYYKKLAKQVNETSFQTQNALLVVAVLIATITYTSMLSPPDGTSTGEYPWANISWLPLQFYLFMVPNSIGFLASLAVIMLVINEYPLKSLLGLSVRCMAASYVCGLLLIGPTKESDINIGLITIATMVTLDVMRIGYWLFKQYLTIH